MAGPIDNTDSPDMEKKRISWNDKEYEDGTILQEIGARSEAWMLDRKASVGPCYRHGLPFEGTSGIMINLPKKSFKNMNQPSGISINISRKCSVTRSKCNVEESKKPHDTENDNDPKPSKYIINVREKLRYVQNKIKSVFQ